jgi:hypothetical protein
LSNEKYRGIRLIIRDSGVVIQAHNPEQEEAEEELEVSYSGEDIEIGFNVNYLLDALGAIEGEEVTLSVLDSNSSCLIRQPGRDTVYFPLTNQLYAAVRGGGATLDGVALRTSSKTELSGAMVGTGQARPGESLETFERLGQSMTAMLNEALVVRASVPATVLLVHVAAGRMEVFWQFSQVRSGLLAGALMVSEAGGVVTDVRGRPWNLNSSDFLAATPALHPGVVEVLSSIT